VLVASRIGKNDLGCRESIHEHEAEILNKASHIVVVDNNLASKRILILGGSRNATSHDGLEIAVTSKRLTASPTNWA
jgi:hypothetical protein